MTVGLRQPPTKEQRAQFFARLEALEFTEEAQRVAAIDGATLDDIISHRRFKHVAKARHAFMWTMRDRFGWSYPAIGAMLGGMDHTSVMAGVLKHDRRIINQRLRFRFQVVET